MSGTQVNSVKSKWGDFHLSFPKHVKLIIKFINLFNILFFFQDKGLSKNWGGGETTYNLRVCWWFEHMHIKHGINSTKKLVYLDTLRFTQNCLCYDFFECQEVEMTMKVIQSQSHVLTSQKIQGFFSISNWCQCIVLWANLLVPPCAQIRSSILSPSTGNTEEAMNKVFPKPERLISLCLSHINSMQRI